MNIPIQEVKTAAKQIVTLSTRWGAKELYMSVQGFDDVVAIAVTHTGTVATSGDGVVIHGEENLFDAIHLVTQSLEGLGHSVVGEILLNPLNVKYIGKNFAAALC